MMKKELKGGRAEFHGERAERGIRVKSREFVYNSPNKENELGSANLLSPASNLSPLSHNHVFLSPPRSTPLEPIEALRSNKAGDLLQPHPQPHHDSALLFSGLSKDGRFRVQSRALEGEELAKAVEFEKRTAMSCTIAAGRDKERPKIPTLEPAKVSSKENGVVTAYAINTHAGTTRSYNEDRVSVTLNIKKNGTRSQFFAVYDGHGGSGCCDYLKDHLHNHLIAHKDFPNDPKRALAQAIALSEAEFTAEATKEGTEMDRSGSCALVVLLVEDYVYVANVGDSRAVLSTEGGRLAFNLSRDHRPIDPKEQQRIFQRGGKVYRTEMTRVCQRKDDATDPIIGPLRIFPGKLSVSRTIGDVQAKEQRLGGVRGVISAQAEIKKFRLTGKEDFMLLCCDGVFERMESMEAIDLAWNAMRADATPHALAGLAVDAILTEAMRRRTADNLTVIMVALSKLRPRTALSP